MSTYTWNRPNEKVRFKGFNENELRQVIPALQSTDRYLRTDRRLDARFVKKSPTLLPNKHVAAETRYHPTLPFKATVRLNPEIFGKNKYEWNPAGVVSHEIGHLIGPTRNTSRNQRQEFKRAFSYKQKSAWHDQAPQQWKARRNNPTLDKTRQHVDAAEDFAETWRAITGEAFTNRTGGSYFNVISTPQRVNYMEKHYLK